LTPADEEEHEWGFGVPSAELDRGDDRLDGGALGAHARPFAVPTIEVPRHPLPDRRRYFLSCLEPSGDFDAVIVAVSDGGRRRYFSTRDGAQLTEVDEVSFERRRESEARSMLELDERELGELEVELKFVRPVRGRDPIAEAEAAEAVEAEAAPEAEHTNMEEEIADVDPVTEEFEEVMMESTTATFEPVSAAASVDAAASVIDDVLDATPNQSAASMRATDAIEQVALAKGIAFMAHRGRHDRSGAPYIDHPGRISERFDTVTEPVEAAAAWLHDVLEDTEVTAQELLEAGVLPAVVDVVVLLTRTPDITPDEYYARIRPNRVARRVKLADIDDNTARWRLRRLDYDTQLRLVEKYRYARQALGTD
jgi:hypothetical protein